MAVDVRHTSVAKPIEVQDCDARAGHKYKRSWKFLSVTTTIGSEHAASSSGGLLRFYSISKSFRKAFNVSRIFHRVSEHFYINFSSKGEERERETGGLVLTGRALASLTRHAMQRKATEEGGR